MENIATRSSGACIQSLQQDNVHMNLSSCNIAVLSDWQCRGWTEDRYGYQACSHLVAHLAAVVMH
jgi:hypothetical protein